MCSSLRATRLRIEIAVVALVGHLNGALIGLFHPRLVLRRREFVLRHLCMVTSA